MDCGAQLRLAWAQSTIEKGLRVLRAHCETLIEIAATRLMLNRLAQA